MLKWDGHTHTQYCKHGNPAEMAEYVERAIGLGFDRYSITEHPPLPDRWIREPRLFAELAMDRSELPAYMNEARSVKDRYDGRIAVAVGLELDYLHGSTSFMEGIIEPYLDTLEDAVVSVHYLPGRGGEMFCIDYTPDYFQEHLLSYYGSMEKVVEEYFDHVEQALEWTRTLPMRKRLGHIGLIEKFRQALPAIDPAQLERRLTGVLPKLTEAGTGIDVNTAGLRVPTCGKPYTPEWFLAECRKQEIALVYGSDSHKPDHVGAGWAWFEEHALG